MMIKVAVVDDQPIIVDGLSMIINFQEDMKVIWTAKGGGEALLKVEANKPDIILMDIRMPEMDGVEATKKIKEKYEDVKILILTTFNEDSYIFETLKHGSSGYLLKDIPPEEIINGIRAAITGGTVIEPSVASKLVKGIKNINKDINRGALDILTERELEIARLISEGFSNKEIGNKLFLSEGTIKNNITSILNKLDLRDRTQIAIFVIKNEI